MIRLNNTRIPLDYDNEALVRCAARELKTDAKSIKSVSIFRRSVDARKKDSIHFLCSLDVEVNTNEDRLIKRCKNASRAEIPVYEVRKWNKGASPVVVGMGPAGLFAALVLAQSGAKPIVIERGREVDKRSADVAAFWQSGILDESSNVQFGEGGAGAFSDGKLNTGTKDFRQRKVLKELVRHGAPEEILYDAKPHIGTDKLKATVKHIREYLISLGASVMFESKLTGFDCSNGKITSVEIERGGRRERLEADSVVLAIGHSARDTFEMLYEKKLVIEQKSFSVGARIEHLACDIDRAQYGKFAGHKALGAASYKLNVHTKIGRGAYTFCMCPGGRVVNASSESGMLVTNGMSEYARDEINSNSALLVGVGPEDYGSAHPLAGMYFQRELEKKAYMAGGSDGKAPVQRVEDFLLSKRSLNIGEIAPSIQPGYSLSDLTKILPEYVTLAMREAITSMGRRLRGFDRGDAMLTAVETRSSSPVRILRNADTLESVSVGGLYPCGEGAGYAGGIISAAVDGIKCAEKIILKSL